VTVLESWISFLLWLASAITQVVTGLQAYKNNQSVAEESVNNILFPLALFSIAPFVTLIIFVIVFIIGGSSNIVQIAGERGHIFWELWFFAWPFLYIANPIALVLSSVLILFPPYTNRNWQLFICRFSAIVTSLCALYVTTTLFPDA
jgi:hypothetical protein